MADIAHVMGADLQVGADGDLAMVAVGSGETEQRVLHRLLTNPGDYLWHQGYGAGLAAMVGQPADVARITTIVRAQMLQEAGVAQLPAPAISVTSDNAGTVVLNARYTDAVTNQNAVLTFPVSTTP